MKYLEAIRNLCKPQKARHANIDKKISKIGEIKAVLWDLYGTLLVSNSSQMAILCNDKSDEKFRQALKVVGIEEIDGGANNLGQAFEDMYIAHKDIRAADGVDNPEADLMLVYEDLLETLIAEEIIEGKITPEKIKMLAIQYEFLAHPVWINKSTVATLEKLKDLGIKMGTVSNAQFFTPMIFPAITEKTMEEIGFDKGACIWSYELRRAKPSPTLFESAAEYFEATYNISPENVLYIGNDMLNDILPAKKIGFKTALFGGDSASLRLRKSLDMDIESDLIFTDLNDIFEVVGK